MNREELEKLRKKARNINLLIIFLGMFVTISIYILTNKPFLIFLSFCLTLILCNFIGGKSTKVFINGFKNTYVLKALSNIFKDLKYDPDNGIDESIIASTKMMDMGDRFSSNDFISGKYKNIQVVQSDIHIEEEHQTTDSDGNTTTTWVTIFRGRWMIFDFNKKFKANIQVSQKGFNNSRINNFGNKNKFKRVKMEDQLFNKKFKIFAQDEHDAFYILTPSLMEKIMDLSNSIKGKIILCFIDNKLHVGINNYEDSFEHSIFKKIDEEKDIEKINKDIKLITDFVDKLNLDNDLFRKGGV